MASATRGMHFDLEPLSSVDCHQLPRFRLSISFWVFLLLVCIGNPEILSTFCVAGCRGPRAVSYCRLPWFVEFYLETHHAGSRRLGGVASCHSWLTAWQMRQVVWGYILPIADPRQIRRPDLRPDMT